MKVEDLKKLLRCGDDIDPVLLIVDLGEMKNDPVSFEEDDKRNEWVM